MKLCTFEYYKRRSGANCCYCTIKLSPSTATRDHYIPKSLGGKGSIRLACSLCNRMKSNIHPQVYLQQLRKVFLNFYVKELAHAS